MPGVLAPPTIPLAPEEGVSSAPDSVSLLADIAQAAAKLVEAPVASFWQADDTARVLRLVASSHPLMDDFPIRELPYGLGVLGRVATQREPIRLPDITADEACMAPQWWRRHRLTGFLGVPVFLEGRLLAVLVLNSGTPVRHDAHDRELFESFLAQAALAIRNAGLLADSEQRRRTAEALVEVGRGLVQSLDLEEVGRRIVESVSSLIAAKAARLYGLEAGTGDLVLLAATGPAPPWTQRLARGTGAIGYALTHAQAMSTADMLTDSRIVLEPMAFDRLARTDYRAALAVPLVANGKPLGVLAIADTTGRIFRDAEVRLAQAFANQAALALGHARLLHELRERQARLEALLDVNRQLGGLQPVEQLLETLAETCARLLDSSAVGFRRLQGDQLVATGAYGDAKDVARKSRLKVGESFAGLVAATGQPLIVNDLAASSDQIPEHREAALRLGHRAFLGVPVKVGDRLVGVLSIRTRNPGGFSDADLAIATAFAAQAAVALENARLFASEQAARAEAETLGERYRNVVESSIQGMCLHDGNVIEFANVAFATTFGHADPASLVGRCVWDLVAPHEVDRIKGYMDARRHGAPAPARYEFQGVRKDRQLVWVEALDTMTSWQGACAYLTTCLDVTERRRAEERLLESQEHVRQMQKMEAVGRLAGGVAHDFNNLLTVITGRTILMLRGLREADPMRADLTLIQNTAQRAAALTRQLLTFSRKQVLKPRVVSVETTVSGLASMLRRLLGEDIALDILATGTPSTVKADPGQLEQVIVNLAVNARDAMPHGGRLGIETHTVDLDAATAGRLGGLRAGPHVMLVVTDSGIGMDDETRARIFEPFFTTKDAAHGTGLGLATVYGIVQQHRGAIAVESAPGRGATFRIYLPRTAESPEAAAVERPAGLPGGRETVLLVEDEDGVRTLTRDILRLAGYTVLEAAHGDEALAIARDRGRAIQLLLTDVIMPRMNGREVAERITADRPGVKVIYMSGYTDNVLEPLSLREGRGPLLQKPFTPEALTRTVREVLDRPA